jgi:hypothetical protein
MNKTLKLLGIAVAAIIVLAVVLVLCLDVVIRKGVETVGSTSLGVETELDRAHLSIPRSRLTLSGLRIANPEDSKTDTLFSVEHARVAVRPRALLAEEITIEEITLKEPVVTIEQSPGGSNLSELFERLDALAAKEAESAETKPKTYRIKKLRIIGAKARFASYLTAKVPVTVPLPDIEMDDISSADGSGLAPAHVVKLVLTRVLNVAVTEGAGTVPADMMKGITGSLPGISDGAAGQTQGAMKKARGAVRGLLGR